MTAIKSAKATVMVDFTVPIYTAIAQLTSFTLGFKPQLVVSNVGIDPTTVGGLLKAVSKGKVSGTALIEGAITDGYLPSNTDTSNPWIQLFSKIHAQYDAKAPFDGNVEYGMANAYTLVQALKAAGKNLTRADLVKAIAHAGRQVDGPRPRPLPLQRQPARRLRRRRDGQDRERQDRALRRAADDLAGRRQPDHPLHDAAAGAADQWGAQQLSRSPSSAPGPAFQHRRWGRVLARLLGAPAAGRVDRAWRDDRRICTSSDVVAVAPEVGPTHCV